MTDIPASRLSASLASRCELNTAARVTESGLAAKRRLHLYSTFLGLNCTSELGKDTIACRVRYTAPMLPNDPVEDRAPFGQPLERGDLVSAHKAAVAFDICCEDRD
jgi:hypothetical protein